MAGARVALSRRILFLAAALLFQAQVFAGLQEMAQKAIPDDVVMAMAISAESADAIKLQRVNDYFNGLRYVTDKRQWHLPDYWSTPGEFMRSGSGDCEDFVIAKYFALLRLGVAAERLRFVMARHIKNDGRFENHMVLLYRDAAAGDLVLDNIQTQIKPIAQRADLSPVYLFDMENMWLWSADQAPEYYGNTKMLVQLQEMLTRI